MLVLYVKAQLEVVASGVISEPQALMPFLALPGGTKTISDELLPALDEAYRTGTMPPLLPAARGGSDD